MGQWWIMKYPSIDVPTAPSELSLEMMRPPALVGHAFVPLVSLIPTILCSSFLASSIEPHNFLPDGADKIRGVNLGGWLVIEAFTTPSLFDNTGDDRIVDEWTFCQYQEKDVASKALKQHYDTFIAEQDFRDIAAAGLNYVRIPIGHWMFNVAADEPYVQGQLVYLLKAVEWARKYRLRIIVALYGAPGSQNGFINSGHLRDGPYWHTEQSYVNRTIAIMTELSTMFAHQTDVVTIIQIMNEPLGPVSPTLRDVLKKYYIDSYNIIRQATGRWNRMRNGGFVVMLHDAFESLSYWDNFMPPSQYEGVMMDSHIYQMFGDHNAHLTYDEHIQYACQNASIMAHSPLPTIIGEWTATNNDCGPHLRGRFVGPGYDGSFPGSTRVGSCVGLTGNASTFSDNYKEFMRKFWEAQTQSYEKGGQGWVMWTWRMEFADEWSYKAGLQHGWIPQIPTDYKYPNICG